MSCSGEDASSGAGCEQGSGVDVDVRWWMLDGRCARVDVCKGEEEKRRGRKKVEVMALAKTTLTRAEIDKKKVLG